MEFPLELLILCMKRFSILRIAAGPLMLVLAAGLCHAGQITQTQSLIVSTFSGLTAPVDVSFPFDRFNPSLGNLTSVWLYFPLQGALSVDDGSNCGTNNVSIDSVTGCARNSGTSTATFTYTMHVVSSVGPSGIYAVQDNTHIVSGTLGPDDWTCPGNYSGAPSCRDAGQPGTGYVTQSDTNIGPFVSDGVLTYLQLSQIQDFAGTGTITLPIEITGEFTITSSNSQVLGSPIFARGQFIFLDTALIYNYDAAVPEPGTIALCGFGFLALAARRRSAH